MYDLSGKVSIVTGVTGKRGEGCAIAKRLAIIHSEDFQHRPVHQCKWGIIYGSLTWHKCFQMGL